MRLYHYLESKWALDDIRRGRVKFSNVEDVNDPYEWACVFSHHKPSQRALDKTRRVQVERAGVLSLSRSWNNVLMWSHYADKHKGICLGFDVLDELTSEVAYVGEVLEVGNLSEVPRDEKEKIVERLLHAKYKGWCYEKEVRMHGEMKEKDEETGLYFMNFDERLKLKEVITGARFPMSKRPIEDALKGYSDDLKIVNASRSLKSFEIIVDEKDCDR